MHATALLSGRSTLLAVYDDGSFAFTTAEGLMAGGRGRMMLTREQLVESGVRLDKGGRLARGSGPIVDEIISEANKYLTQAWNEAQAWNED
ncbi:hypothetical protein [Nocardia niwae]|uniref:hypothetical protein n=1 Tax=Nocardia niwae TaxID=626084 RepID=UPI0012F49356|nr:hypothetical protein [Nocardia niwae]